MATPCLFSPIFPLGSRRARNGVIATARPGGYSVVAGPVSSRRRLVRPWNRRPLRRKTTARALEVERRFAGRGISIQAFAIAPKIAEVDALLLSRHTSATPTVREVHPELCFWSLNNQRPMEFSKKKSQGKAERLRVLEGIEPRSQEIYQGACSRFLRKVVARDDILDALVAALIARERTDQLQSIPDHPPKDAKGLPIEMVF